MMIPSRTTPPSAAAAIAFHDRHGGLRAGPAGAGVASTFSGSRKSIRLDHIASGFAGPRYVRRPWESASQPGQSRRVDGQRERTSRRTSAACETSVIAEAPSRSLLGEWGGEHAETSAGVRC